MKIKHQRPEISYGDLNTTREAQKLFLNGCKKKKKSEKSSADLSSAHLQERDKDEHGSKLSSLHQSSILEVRCAKT